MPDDLFRTEVLEARRDGWLGAISLAQPLGLWILTAFSSASALLVVLYLLFGTYTRRSTVEGNLVPTMGLSTVLAPAAGVVSQLYAEEGDLVEEGEFLAIVSFPRATFADGDTTTALEERLERRREALVSARSAQWERIAVQRRSLSEQLESARHERMQVESEISTRREQVRISNETLSRLRELEEDRFVSLLQIKQQESDALTRQSELQSLERQTFAAQRRILELEQSLKELSSQAQTADATHKTEIARLEQERLEGQARDALGIRAPLSGAISAQLVKPGQAVTAGQPLLTLLPGDGQLEAELLVPSRDIGFIEPGDRVILRYQPYPYQKFGHHQGTVARISRSAITAADLGQAEASEPRYRITVVLSSQTVTAYGKHEVLKPGMLLEADILGERRQLLEWLLEPLYSLSGRLAER